MDKIFSEGIYLNTVHEKAPEFIKANVSIHIDKAIVWLQAQKALGNADEKGYIKLTGKESKNGKRYFELDTWKPKEATPQTAGVAPEYPSEDVNPEDVPF